MTLQYYVRWGKFKVASQDFQEELYMRVGLSVYGTMYGMGINNMGNRPTITPIQLLEKAHSLGLEGVEIPLNLMGGAEPADVVKYAKERNMFIRAETGGLQHEKLNEDLKLAAKLGSPTLRTIIGGAKLGGDRRPLAGKWKEYMKMVHTELSQTMDTAKSLNMAVLLENHQDITSEEILELGEKLGSENFGIVLDCGNAMATVEEPVAFAKKVAKYIKHVHLKDYWLYMTEEGYRLVRCPIGQGYMDFPAIFKILHEKNPNMTMTIEIGALEARHVRMLADDFWPDYPVRTAPELAKVVAFALKNAKPAADWRTPHERGESVEAVIAYEDRELLSSIAYVQQLLKKYK